MGSKFAYNNPEEMTVADVVNIQNNALFLLSGGIHSYASPNYNGINILIGNIVDTEKDHLIRLKRTLESREKIIYNKAGGEKQFFEKVKAWSSNHGGVNDFLQNTSLITSIIAIVNKYKPIVTLDDLNKALIKIVESETTDKDFLKNFVLSQVFSLGDEECKNALSEFLGEMSLGEFMGVSIKGATNSGKRGFLSLDFKMTEKKGGYYSQLTKTLYKKNSKGEKITKSKNLGITTKTNQRNKTFSLRILNSSKSATIEKLKEKLNDELVRQQQDDAAPEVSAHSLMIAEIQATLLRYIQNNIQIEAIQNVYATVLQRFLVQEQLYDINRNYNVIQGFLGELYWTAFAWSLFGERKNSPVLPIGGARVPTDIQILEQVGFQVKNYTSINGIVTYNGYTFPKIQSQTGAEGDGEIDVNNIKNNTISLNALFRNRYGWGDTGVEVMGKYYFSEAYNQTIDTEHAQRVYTPVRNRFANINRAIESYVSANKGALLNFDTGVNFVNMSDTIYEYDNFDEVRPTFFAINDKLIPSSTLIDEILLELNKSNNNSGAVSIIFSNVTIHEASQLEKIRETPWDNQIDSALANYSQILIDSQVDYRIDIKVDELFNSILNNLNIPSVNTGGLG